MPKKDDVVRGYKIIEKIKGKSVFIVSKPENENLKFVMKISEGGVISNEIKIGMSLWKQCPYLVRIIDFFPLVGDDEVDDLYFIMEFCEEGDLAKRIKMKTPPTDVDIYRFVFEASSAIDVLHKNNIIHRDIKPGNFFIVKDGGVKLGDYGIARILLPTISIDTMTLVGTEGYISPEILKGERVITNKTDIFSFGITLLEFIVGRHPFSNPNGAINTEGILKGTPIPAALHHPHPCAKLALRMVAVDPAARPSIADVLAAIGLPLFAPLHSLCVENWQLKKQLEANSAKAEKTIPFAVELRANPSISAHITVKGGKASHNDSTYRLKEGEKFFDPHFQAGFRTFVVDTEIYAGIFKTTFLSTCTVEESHCPFFGLVHKSKVSTIHNTHLFSGTGMCLFNYDSFRTGERLFWMDNVKDPWFYPVMHRNLPIALEVNMHTRTMHVFVGNDDSSKQLPFCIIGIPLSVFFAFSLHFGTAVEVKSLFRLPVPTIDPSQKCTEFKWIE